MNENRFKEARQRMMQASEDLHVYLRAPAQDRKEYSRLLARFKTATDEYYLLMQQSLEDKYAEIVSQAEQKRPA